MAEARLVRSTAAHKSALGLARGVEGGMAQRQLAGGARHLQPVAPTLVRLADAAARDGWLRFVIRFE